MNYEIYVINTANPNPNKSLVATIKAKGDALLILSTLNKSLAEGTPLEYTMEEVDEKETITLKDCVWGEEHPVKTTNEHIEVASSKDYSNGRHTEVFHSVEDAVDIYGKKRCKDDGYDKTWNDQDEIITKVTTIREIVKVIKSEDKK